MRPSVRFWTPQDCYDRWDYLMATSRFSILVPHSEETYARRGGHRSEHDRPVLILANGECPVQVHLRKSHLDRLNVDPRILSQAIEAVDTSAAYAEESDPIDQSRAAAHLIATAVEELMG